MSEDDSTYYESTEDEITDDELDEVYDYEDTFREEDLIHSQYCIGTIFYPNKDTSDDLLLDKRIHTKTFFKFPFSLVHDYGLDYGYNNYFKNQIEICQLRCIDNFYFVIIKTRWLIEIQRKWKKIYKERKHLIESIRQNPGRYLDSINRTGSFIKRQ